ncbi:MAG: PRC-barrel domain containing protein [Candidatus Solibacter sp.]|jgi:hypothetical protein|nr:PRC-barrel domain containing protein [Candidatus Solibacter sp.]
MITNAGDLKGFTIRATDGEIGTVEQFYFDDVTWAVRYLTVDTGGWLAGRQVLISPYSIVRTDWNARHVDLSLTKEQVRNSPGIDTHEPVSRQHEAEFLGYYGYPYYWGGPYLWGSGYSPIALTPPVLDPGDVAKESMDSHLRSSLEVTGYHIEASDGEIGHLDGFVVDDESWAIRYIEVATRNWWPGKKVLFSPSWIERVSWADSRVYVVLSREAIQNAPIYAESIPITREYENGLYFHYGRPPYWLNEAEHSAARSLVGVE